jgi:hypothetical protein
MRNYKLFKEDPIPEGGLMGVTLAMIKHFCSLKFRF